MVNKNGTLLEKNVLGTVILRCDDCCSMLVVDKYEWGFTDNNERDINYNISIQDSSYHVGRNSLWERLKRAWKCLVGKPIYYNDIWIENVDRVNKFKEDLEKLINN